MKNVVAPDPVDFAEKAAIDSASAVVFQRITAIVFSGAYLSLSVAGIGSIVFGCADLAAGFVTFSFQWSLAYLLTYVWAGFLFAIVNGAFALKAAFLKSQMSANCRSAVFCLSIVTLALHTIDFVTVAASVVTLACYYSGEEREVEREEPLLEYPGMNEKGNRPFNITMWNYYFYQTPLVSESPRFVIVSTLLALDIWLIVVASKLRSYFNQQASPTHAAAVIYANFASENADAMPAHQSNQRTAEPSSVALSYHVQQVAGSQSQRRDTLDLQKMNTIIEMELLSKSKVAFIVAGIGSIVFGIGQSITAVLTTVTWLWFQSEFSWFNRGFAGVTTIFAIVNGSVALRGASSASRMKSHCSNLVIFGFCSLIVYFLATSLCVYNLAEVGELGPKFYRSDSQSSSDASYRVINRVYVRIVTPAVPEAARLVILFVLVTVTIMQVYFARKLAKHVRSKRVPVQVSSLDTTIASSYPTIVLPISASFSAQQQQKSNTVFMLDSRCAQYSTPICPGLQSSINETVSCYATPSSVIASLPYIES